MGGWGNLADVRVNTQCGVSTETYVPYTLLEMMYGCLHFDVFDLDADIRHPLCVLGSSCHCWEARCSLT